MTIPTADLLQSLTAHTQRFVHRAQALRHADMDTLTQRPNPDAWNALECLEHLNLYGDHYLPAMAQQMEQSTTPPSPSFKAGLLGNYMTESMRPKSQLNKMKTFADKNPMRQLLDKTVIDRFLTQQTQMLALLARAHHVNLNAVKVKTTLPLLRFNLGDTFRFVIEHNARHFEQLERAVSMDNGQ